MSTTLKVGLGDRSYAIHIGAGVLASIAEAVTGLSATGNVLVVSDSHVAPLYAEQVLDVFRRAGRSVKLATVPAGEESKSEQRLFELYAAAHDAGLDRRGLVVALGGGVVGDVTGFMAATWLRGVAWVQVPTTVLAMVDSAVGGKTAINLPVGKNLVGAFYQPSVVLADLDTLASLPARELRSGLAEVVKTGAIRDPDMLVRMENASAAVTSGESKVLEPLIARCCAIKADVVARDERESGERAILNFGHTLGHALEQVAGYGAWLHGEAVSVGMVFAARLSVRLAGLPPAEAEGLTRLLSQLGLPVNCPGVPWSAIRQAMISDKKTIAGVLRFVLLKRLGVTVVGVAAPESALEEAWHVVSQ